MLGEEKSRGGGSRVPLNFSFCILGDPHLLALMSTGGACWSEVMTRGGGFCRRCLLTTVCLQEFNKMMVKKWS